jgi:hypothetical protein
VGKPLSKRSTTAFIRRWFRFSLRTLFLVTTVLAIWLAFKVHAARQQQEAVALYLRLGGTIRYDYEIDQSGRLIRNATPSGWPWLRSYVGSEYFDSVSVLSMTTKPVSDPDTRPLVGLPHLLQLWLGHTKISDDAMDSISQLRMLRQLELSNTGITDTGLMRLLQLPHLTYLQLDSTTVTDEGVESLLKLPSLQEVSLTGTRVTEKGVRRLIEAGKQVCCTLDPHIEALDELGRPRKVLTAGEQVPLRGTFYVPTGAKPYSGPAIVMIHERRPDMGGQRVTVQSGVANYVQVGPTTYVFNTVLQLPPSLKTVMPGELEVSGLGGTICVEPLQELRPAAEGPETQQ